MEYKMNNCIPLLLIVILVCTVNCEQFKCDESVTSTTCTIRNYNSDINFELHPHYRPELKTTVKLVNSTIKIVPSQLFENFPIVTTLDLTGCSVQEIPPKSLRFAKNLIFLNLSNNLLTQLYGSQFIGAQNLVRIDLSDNKIDTIIGQPFYKLNKLSEINLSNNQIRIVDNDLFLMSDVNSNFQQNGSISLNNNDIEKLHLNSNLGSILSANNNALQSDNVTTGYTQHFIQVSLKNNSLTRFNFIRDMINLAYLDLSGNPLRFDRDTDLEIFSKLLNLKTLILNSVNLYQLDQMLFNVLPRSLEILDIGSNNMKTLNFNGLSLLDNLEQLFINDNQLGDMTFNELKYLFPHLQIIDISENDWQCTNLIEALSLFKQLDIQQVVKKIMKIKSNQINIRGIGCEENFSHEPVTVIPQPSLVICETLSDNKTSQNDAWPIVCENNFIVWFIAIIVTLIVCNILVITWFLFCCGSKKTVVDGVEKRVYFNLRSIRIS